MDDVVKIVIAVVVTALVVAFVTAKIAISYHTKLVEAKIGNADEKAREIIDEALKTAEAKKKEALLEAKEESIRKPRTAGQRCSVTRSGSSPRRRLWTASWSLWKRRNRSWFCVSRRWKSSAVRWRIPMQSRSRNWKRFLD